MARVTGPNSVKAKVVTRLEKKSRGVPLLGKYMANQRNEFMRDLRRHNSRVKRTRDK